MGNLRKSKQKKLPLYIQKSIREPDYKEQQELAVGKALKTKVKSFEELFAENVKLIASGCSPIRGSWNWDWNHTQAGVFQELYTAFNDLSQSGKKGQLNAYTMLLEVLEAQKCYELVGHLPYLKLLRLLIKYNHAFVRDFSDWKRKSRNPAKQLNSLIDHVFILYPVAPFMYSAWENNAPRAHIDWFIRMGRGESVKKLPGLPIELSKKAAHAFVTAPDHLSIAEALRHAQVVGAGGSERLAAAVNGSLLGRNNFENEAFWSEAIHFFVRAGMFDTSCVSEIVDYLQANHLQNPAYSFKGRTVGALMRQTQEWHRMLHRRAKTQENLVWEACETGGFVYEETRGEFMTTSYHIKELLSGKELNAEGARQKHCVGGYAAACKKRKTAIFVLYSDVFGYVEPMLTIELDLASKTIVQVRGKFNRQMTEKEQRILEKWAEKEFLRISKWV